MDAIYDKVNDYGSVSIRLASPNDIMSWSYGEVKKPETINYRTYRPEKDGLFCERIFGPERDWECFCGKYKGIKHRGIICDRCGIKIIHSRVRRQRMGHITLAAPVVHIWFFKATPSRLGNLLAMKTSSLERVVYYQDYVVIDPGDAQLKEKQLLTEEEYRYCREKYGDSFEADTGAEAVRKLMSRIDLDALVDDLKAELKTTKSKQKTKDIIKRLKIAKAIIDSENSPDWMIMDVVPVIPPDLRPLVLLESGNFATSDLNDLYRRLINRNNRLKKLLDLNAPDVIIRNEKRMLQHSVDALFDNNRCRRPVLGSNNRPLKSLTDMIKGKQGRFRENLLGKRVDYSARSVIAVGPELHLHQCGLPKKIALELFQPFIIRRLKELGHADTIKSAKKMLERKDEEVWDILEEVIHEHPVLLNRAPTLHRVGIQAFEPVLIEGNAILIHPLVCEGFNADFDGDQMAVHLPLSIEAQVEASTLMLSTNNVFAPSSGRPIIAPSQDIVLGCYYLTATPPGPPIPDDAPRPTFSSAMEVFTAHLSQKVNYHSPIRVRVEKGRTVITEREELKGDKLYNTTVGRVYFNDILPKGMGYYDMPMKKSNLARVISDCYQILGRKATLGLLDGLKELGFKLATQSGISFASDDLRIPDAKAIALKSTQAEVEKVEGQYQAGVITEGERYNQIIDLWTRATEKIGDALLADIKVDERDGQPYLNPIFVMVDSGARGSVTQIRQLAGMRGLMAKPSGKIIETPIKASFREGLRVLEYFSSTHGARKGLADTALKTADSGYLTRKLADVAQNVVITDFDCGTLGGITKAVVYKGDKIEVPLWRSITGRVSRTTIKDIVTDEVLVEENGLITEEIAKRIEALGFDKVRVRSALTCDSSLGICAACYGMDRSTGRGVEQGLAVGIIAAQSIGEPGTQLTMRTFHIGGIASKTLEDTSIVSKAKGVIKFQNVKFVRNPEGQNVVLNRNGEIYIVDSKGRELERHLVPAGAVLHQDEDSENDTSADLISWEAHMIPILGEMSGVAEYEDIVEGVTMKIEKDPVSGTFRRSIIEHKGDLHPQIVIKDRNGDPLAMYPIPEKAYIEVESGTEIQAGALLAKTPREISGTQDITGGLPRVTEIFEVRRPKNPSVIAEIDGEVEIGEKKRGKATLLVKGESGVEVSHVIPHGKHFRVHRGDVVKAGDPLVDGALIPKDILRINGEEAVQQYLLREVQNVYRSQSVTIDDKHIEIIVAQMLRNVQVLDSGDTEILPGTVIDKFRFRFVNEQVQKDGRKPASAEPLLLGITKASLQSESFISAASFQETTKVLTEAALAGKTDYLVGLKENVILGHLVPAGTGFRAYLEQGVRKLVDPPERKKPVEAVSDGSSEPQLVGAAAPAAASSSGAPVGGSIAGSAAATVLRDGLPRDALLRDGLTGVDGLLPRDRERLEQEAAARAAAQQAAEQAGAEQAGAGDSPAGDAPAGEPSDG